MRRKKDKFAKKTGKKNTNLYEKKRKKNRYLCKKRRNPFTPSWLQTKNISFQPSEHQIFEANLIWLNESFNYAEVSISMDFAVDEKWDSQF